MRLKNNNNNNRVKNTALAPCIMQYRAEELFYTPEDLKEAGLEPNEYVYFKYTEDDIKEFFENSPEQGDLTLEHDGRSLGKYDLYYDDSTSELQIEYDKSLLKGIDESKYNELSIDLFFDEFELIDDPEVKNPFVKVKNPSIPSVALVEGYTSRGGAYTTIKNSNPNSNQKRLKINNSFKTGGSMKNSQEVDKKDDDDNIKNSQDVDKNDDDKKDIENSQDVDKKDDDKIENSDENMLSDIVESLGTMAAVLEQQAEAIERIENAIAKNSESDKKTAEDIQNSNKRMLAIQNSMSILNKEFVELQDRLEDESIISRASLQERAELAKLRNNLFGGK